MEWFGFLVTIIGAATMACGLMKWFVIMEG